MSILKISLFFHSFVHFVLPRISSTFGDSCNFRAKHFRAAPTLSANIFFIAAAQTVTQTVALTAVSVWWVAWWSEVVSSDRKGWPDWRIGGEGKKRVCSIMKKNPNRVKWRFRKWSTHWLSQCRFVFRTGKFHTISSYSQLASPPNTIAKCFLERIARMRNRWRDETMISVDDMCVMPIGVNSRDI